MASSYVPAIRMLGILVTCHFSSTLLNNLELHILRGHTNRLSNGSAYYTPQKHSR